MEKKDVNRNVDLITLCYILDDFDEFSKDLAKVKSNYNRLDIIEFAKRLVKISRGEFVFGSSKIKTFYEKYRNVIEVIKSSSCLYEFICFNYDDQGNLTKDNELEFFYSYFLAHRDKLDKILSLLSKIKELGISNVIFDEEADFNDICYVSFDSINVSYFDNMAVVPSYSGDWIMYKTMGSNYKIELSFLYSHVTSKKITLNSLLFDSNRLPNNISWKNIMLEFIKLRDEKKDEYVAVENSFKLCSGINGLYSQFDSINEVVQKIDSAKCKSELQEVLSEVSQSLGKLEAVSDRYDDIISQMYPSITKESLEEQKRSYSRKKKKDVN